MAITRYAGDRFVIGSSPDVEPTGVLDGAYLINTGNLSQKVLRNGTWTTLAGGGGGGSPGGDNTQVQFNNAGSFGGSTGLTFDGQRLFANNLQVSGVIYDSNVSVGENGMVLTNEGQTGIHWKNIESVLSGVGGSGVANYVARWSDEDTLTSGVIQDNGTAVGINQAPDGPNLLCIKAIENNANVLQIYADDGNGLFNIRQSANNCLIRGYKDEGVQNIQLHSDGVSYLKGGSVGIGNNAPGCELHVSGEDPRIRVDGITDSHPGFELSENGTRKWITYNNYVNDNLTFKTNADIRMVIQQDGNVGIGTTAPYGKLEVYANGSEARLRIHEDAGTHSALIHLRRGGADWEIANNSDLGFSIESTRVVTFKYGGKVGIGTDAPDTLLDLQAAAGADMLLRRAVGDTSSNLGVISFGNADVDKYLAQIKAVQDGATDSARLEFQTEVAGGAKATRMTIKSDGNVGIGDNLVAPEHKLHVSGDAIISGVLYDSTNSSGVAGHVFTSEAGGPQWKMIEDVLSGVGGNGTATYIPQWIDSDTIGDSVMAQSGSAIGIGTAAPSYQLSVEAQGNDDGYLLTNTSAVTLAELKQEDSNAGRLTLFDGGVVKISLNADASQDSYFNNGGKVGIGTGAPSFTLHANDTNGGIIGATRTVGSTTGMLGRLRFGNTDVDSNLVDIYAIQDGATDSARLVFATQATGGATAEQMIIKSDGNVGIGTTDPSYRLHVKEGGIRIDNTGNTKALVAIATSTTESALQVEADSLTTGRLCNFYSNASGTQTREVVRIWNDNALSTGTIALKVIQDSTAPALVALGNVGIGTDAPGGRLDVGTGYMVNEQGRQDHVANTLPQPYYWFDGVNDRIRGTASSKLNFYGHTKMTLMVRFKAGPSAGLDTPYLFGWFADSSNSILIAYPFTSGNPFVRSEFAESNQSDDLVGIPRNTDVNVIVLTVDGSNYSAYHNGKFILTFAGEDIVNCQDVDGKAHWAESGGSYWEGSVYQSQIWNTVLTDTEIKEISSGASVPYEYKGASNTHLVTAGSCTEQGSGTINSSSATAFNFSSGAIYDRIGFTLSSTLTAGKKYRISWTALTSSSGYIQVRSATTSAFLDAGGTNFGSVSGGAGSFEWVALGDEAYITFKNLATPTTVVLTGFRVVQVGAVADYDGSGMIGDTWYDKSGNNLDATVTGSSLENRATALIVDDRVGIGTTTPSQKLHSVASAGGRAALFEGAANWYAIKVQGSTTTNQSYGPLIFAGTSSSDFALKIHNFDESANLFAIRGDGNVGIGTNSPGSILHLNHSSEHTRLRMQTIATKAALIDFYSASAVRWSWGVDNNQGYAKFENRTTANDAIRLVDSNDNVLLAPEAGKVGIGTTASPSYLLHLSAAAADIKVTSTTGANRAGIQATNSGGTSYFYKESSGGGGAVPGTLPYATVVGGGGHTQFATNNTVKATILTDGNLGIGDNLVAPEHRLHVSGDAIISGVLYDSTNSSGVAGHVFTSEAGGPQWKMIEDVLSGVGGNGTAEYIPRWTDSDTIGDSVMAQSGSAIGIGTASPFRKFHVYATGDQTNENDGAFWIGDSTNDKMGLYGGVNNTSNYSYIGSVRTSQAYEDLILNPNGGNVGIGTNSTSELLHAYKAVDAAVAIAVENPNAGTDARARIQLMSNGGTATLTTYSAAFTTSNQNIADSALLRASSLSGGLGLSADGATPLRFWTNDTERIRVDSGGNVGVGTTTPKTLLEASGVIRSTHATSVTAGVGIEMLYNNTDGTGYLYSYDRDGSAYKTTRIGSESYFIADGNVGIATATPEHQFQVYGDALISGKFYDSTNSTGDKGYVLTSDDTGPLWAASGDFDGLSGNLIATGQTLQTQITSNDTDIAANTANLITTGQTLQTQITANDGDISTLTSNLITTGQTLQTQITSNDTDIATNATNIATNVTNIATNATNIATNVTNISTNASNLITTGQYLTDEINTVSGLIPATVIDGGGTANKVPLWSDANTIGDSVIAQSGSAIGIGTTAPTQFLDILATQESDAGIRVTLNCNLDSQAPQLVLNRAAQNGGIVDSGDVLGVIKFGGYDGNSVENSAKIEATVNGTPSNDNMPTDLSFYTASAGSPVRAMTIDKDQQVGIGTTAPLGILSLPGADTTTKPQIRFQTGAAANLADAAISTTDDSGGTNVMIGANQYWSGGSITRFVTDRSGSAIDFGYAGRMKFYTGEGSAAPTERMRIERDGNVGIGTNNPSEVLDVDGNIAMAGNAVTRTIWNKGYGGAVQLLRSDANATRWAKIGIVDASGNFVHGVTILNDGKVGIGNTSPIAQLHLQVNASGGHLHLTRSDNSLTGQMGEITFGNRNYDDYLCKIRATCDSTAATAAGAGGFLAFDTEASGGSLTERLRIAADGNVGIGTDAPGLSDEWLPTAETLSVIGSSLAGSVEIGHSEITNNIIFGALKFVNPDNSDASQATNRFVAGLYSRIQTSDNNAGDDSGGSLHFTVKPEASTLLDALTIHSDTKIGMGSVFNGTVTPSSKLSVGGNSTQTLKPTVAIVDMTAGAMLQLRGQAPTIFMDSTSSGIPTILTDGRGIEIKDGTLDAQGVVDFVIDANGDVGIGTDNPAYRCDVYDTVANIAIFRSTITSYARVIIRSGASGDAQLAFQNNTSTKWSIGNDGGDSDKFKIGVGGGAFVASEAVIIDTSGNLSILGTLTEASSLTIKENIETYSPSLENISKIRPVRFNKKKSKKKEVGLVAEELAEMFPELVETDEKGNPSGVNYSRAVAVLLHGFKELYKEVKELKEKI